jgi:DNA-binding winged helix-turn-helix (wHTH) protein
VSPIDDRHEHAELRILAALVRSAAALVAGRDGVARALAQKAIDEANAEGYGTLESEARVRAAEAGAPLGAISGAPDLVAHGRFFSLDPVALIGIAPGNGSASRRARALLGDDVALDAIDRRVVERVRTKLSVRRIGPTASGAFVPGLLLDERDRSAHLGDRRIDFSARPLFWRILRALVDGGGVASKERLTLDAWEESEYHPLRHDGRIWVAIRKLRARLEDDAKNPRWIVTKDDGYAFDDVVRFVS